MVNYSWDKLAKYCKNDYNKIVKELPRLGYNFPGFSFILDLDSLINHKYCTKEDKVVYLWLCSLRNYADYAIAENAGLSKNCVEVSDFDIKRNPLLSLNNHTILFLYEEQYKNGKIIQERTR